MLLRRKLKETFMKRLLPVSPTKSPRPSIRWVSTIAAALGALSLTGGLFAAGGYLTLPTSICGALLSAVVMWSSLAPEGRRGEIPYRSTGKCLGLGCLLGGFNALPSFLATTLVLGELSWTRELPFALIMVALVGLFVGVPLGLLYAAFYTIPLVRARKLHNRDSLEGGDRMLEQAGAWLISISTAALAFGLIVGIPACGGVFDRHGPSHQMAPLVASCAPGFVTGLVFIVIAAQRIRDRRAWIGRVVRGLEPEWAIVSRDELIGKVDGIHPLGQEGNSLERVLVQIGDGKGHGAYRHGKELIPWAFVEAETK